MKLTGTFYYIGEKEDVLESIDEAITNYNRKGVSCNKHDGALLKAYCHAAMKVLDTYFASDLRAVRKCRRHFEKLSFSDSLDLVPLGFLDVSDTLNNLKTIVKDSVKISDMPSCKDMLELSVEDAVSVANDFNSERNSKGLITIGLLGKKKSVMSLQLQISDHIIKKGWMDFSEKSMRRMASLQLQRHSY